MARRILLPLAALFAAVAELGCADEPDRPIGTDASPCDGIAEAICTAIRGCCEEKGAYDESGCRARVHASCDPSWAAHRDGKVTFDASRASACVVASYAYFADCHRTFAAYSATASRSLFACEHVFWSGSGAHGASCTSEEGCALPADPRSVPTCDADTARCGSITVVGASDWCTVTEGLDTRVCAEGLSCERRSANALEGTCEPSTIPPPEGDQTSASLYSPSFCGLR